jgi:hypothetical protein
MTLIGLFTALLAAAGTLSAVPANAAGMVLYQYNFSAAKVTGSTVPNLATGTFAGVSLTLFALKSGDWSFANNNQGIQFTGDTTAHQSVAFGKPSSGDTINVPNAGTLGAGVQFTFQAPQSSTCNDTPNVAQIGRAGTSGVGQVKIQLDNCTSGQPTHVQCRIAGTDSTVTTDHPVDVTGLTLTNGHQYNVKCTKDVGDGSGNATITVTVIDKTTSTTVTASASRPVGDVVSTEYVSAANKYPLPTLSANTDQFNGILYTESYCSGLTMSDVTSCITGTFRGIT